MIYDKWICKSDIFTYHMYIYVTYTFLNTHLMYVYVRTCIHICDIYIYTYHLCNSRM